jgi:polygalacturonase
VTIDRLVIDTQRDGIDLDAVTDATVTNCRVNSPNDDAIVVKASYGLERLAASENIVIRDCEVSGYDLGTLVDSTRQLTQQFAPDRDRPTGRIKLGTESNGGYRHILIERCRFDHCRGLALETVDGGAMEDVTVRSLRLNDVTSAPIFVRLGDRRRGPSGTQIGSTRGIAISDFEATAIDPRFAAMIAGIPGHPVTGVMLRNIHLQFLGGGSAVDAARVPEEHAEAYPEPSMFGTLPAWGLWVRHARDVTIDRLTMETLRPDARPPILVQDAQDVHVTATPLWKGPS